MKEPLRLPLARALLLPVVDRNLTGTAARLVDRPAASLLEPQHGPE